MLPPPEYPKLRPTAARIQNFRCFHDTGWAPLDDVTVLVAENEFGKTTFLQALAWFDRSEPLDQEDRRVGADGQAPVVSLRFELDPYAQNALTNKQLARCEAVFVTKHADGTYVVADAATDTNVAESNLQNFRRVFDGAREQLLNSLQGIALSQPDAAETKRRVTDLLTGSDVEQIGGTAGAVSLLTTQITIALPDEMADTLTMLGKRMNDASDSYLSALAVPIETLRPYLASFVYFDGSVDFLPDTIVYEHVTSGLDEHRTEVNLAKLMGFDAALLSTDGFGRQQQGQQLSHRLSQRFDEFWNSAGAGIQIYLHVEPTEMHVVIDHVRPQPPSRRSRGLQWFLGFYTKFAAETDEQLRDSVLLIDEPGLYLHVKQQTKFLELLEQLSESNTIIYSTHLPYLIPRNRLSRVRLLVADEQVPGAVTVQPNIYSVSSKADVLQPIRAALGVGVADSITLGTSTIGVEGAADMYLLDAMNTFCRRANRQALPAEVTILPAGGSGEKMMWLAAFLASGQMTGALLVDSDTAGRSTRRLARERFDELVAVEFTRSDDEALDETLEDLVDRDYYAGLANETLAQRDGAESVATADLPDGSICKALQKVFKEREYGDFQKLKAALILQARAQLEENPPPDPTLAAFEDLFARLMTAMRWEDEVAAEA